jgi:hypothetical protein
MKKRMKKLFLMVTMLVAAVSANAQLEQGTFSIQPKAGATISWLSNMPSLNMGTTELDKTPTVGAILGAEAEYQLAEKFSVAAGINYAQQGCGWSDYKLEAGNNKAELKDAKIELGYVNVPITANYYLFKGFAVKAGVQFGFLTSAKLKGTITTEYNGAKSTTDLSGDDFKDQCKKLDVSIPVGISYEFKVPVVIDLRYNIGLMKVNKDSEAGHKDFKNNVIQLTVGYKLAL